MQRTASRCFVLRSGAALLTLLGWQPSICPAAVSQWNTDSSGNFSDAINWDIGVPGLADTATFRRGNVAYTVDFIGDVATDKLRVGSNTVTFQSSAGRGTYTAKNAVVSSTNPGIIIGELAADKAVVNSYLLQWSANFLILGNVAGSAGTLNLLAGSINLTKDLFVGKSGSGRHCRNLLVLAKLRPLNTSYRVGDDKQISQGGGRGGAGHSATRVAGLCPPEQPQEVHAAPVVRLLGAEELLAHRLPRRGRAAA